MKRETDYKREFLTIDTEEKAYFLGYFYGDGCLHSRKQYDKLIYQSSVLSKDKEIILKFRSIFKFFGIYESKGYHTICSYSPELYFDLASHGLYERKSFENKDKLVIPDIKDELIGHFIRGFYDADGGYYLYDSLIETFCCGSSLSLLTSIQEWFYSKGVILNIGKKKNKEFYHLRSKSNKTFKVFYELVYKNASIYLHRKFAKIKKADLTIGPLKTSNDFLRNKSTKKQKERLKRDYKKVIELVKDLKEIKNPSICCGYHTVKSGKSYKKNTKRPLYLCLKCGKRSVYNKVSKQDELTGTSLEF